VVGQRRAQRPCSHAGCHKTYCKERTPFYENSPNKAKGYHLRRTAGIGKKRKRQADAYECLNPDCGLDYRVVWNEDLVAEWGAPFGCPLCGGLYVEWLSFNFPPEDVYLDTWEEWALVPKGRVLGRDPAVR
jgi:hypothetical protein